MKMEFEFRGIQMDLARQPETLEHIKEFIDFIAENGYNCLTLYLEGRIRTKTFPLMEKTISYTPDEMRKIVDYAGRKKLDVLPVVSTLGHAELFLSRPELAHLGELRGGRAGRFGNANNMFCPSLDETYKFLEAYLKEVSALFPFGYFHAGCDEAWNIGCCEFCRKKDHATIFAEHLKRTHEIVSVTLGKKMMIWDDLFEYYPSALEKIPRDIVMCTWHYDKLIKIPKGHFGWRPEIDRFAIYDKMGFEYIFTPAVFYLRNICSFTEYASMHKPKGALLTMWCLSRSFPFSAFPAIAYAGRLWSGNFDFSKDESFPIEEFAIRDTCGIEDKPVVSILRNVLNTGILRNMPSERNNYLKGILSEDEFDKYCLVQSALTALDSYRGTNDVVDGLLLALQAEADYYGIRMAVGVLLKPLSLKARKKAAEILRKRIRGIEELKISAFKLWEKNRKGLPICTDEFYEKIMKMLEALAGELEKDSGFMEISLFLPSCYGVQNMHVKIRYEGGGEKWETVTEGVFKQAPSKEPFYSYSFPVSPVKVPESVMIESSGFGGQGISFIKVLNSRGFFVPGAISMVSGRVQNPEHILSNDYRWCWIGEPDTTRAFLLQYMACERHQMEIIFTRR